ncbi:hypothetical protein L1987_11424 [Smallanthus sonchifolius]|uniref:Uncharacterized protein n=1 Tax=Smallanthus sonchifolius TaxID=185202 RepID=A0ACB9JAY1_9ASTR|nr:hypothetical protein L1987_11424 [Smallanthus sonchifolius]
MAGEWEEWIAGRKGDLGLTSSAKGLLQNDNSPQIGHSSFGQAVVNGVNLLCGVALLSTSYAMKQGGWARLSILFIFCVLSFYTGILLHCCLDSRPGLQTYPYIGEAAFGIIGRLVISLIDKELFWRSSCNDSFGHLLVLGWISGLHWLSDSTTILNLSTLPVSIGLYGYCYAGHVVLPNIYMSMAKKSQYPLVLLACFTICTFLYAGVAILGYMMFGESTESQFTLNLPTNLVASKIAVWATVR